jgi:hypothetical protein
VPFALQQLSTFVLINILWSHSYLFIKYMMKVITEIRLMQ